MPLAFSLGRMSGRTMELSESRASDEPLPTAVDGSADRHRAVRQTQARSRRSAAYELFVLGELVNGPMHGYLLREILNRVLGPYRTMSWGVLYPLIHAL